MPAILIFQLANRKQGQTVRVNADRVISYEGDETATELTMQGINGAIYVKHPVADVDAMFRRVGFYVITSDTASAGSPVTG